MDLTKWQKAQSYELAWHKRNPWRANDDAFEADTKRIMERFGFGPDDFSSVIDAGAGPRLRSLYFRKAVIYAIEPLADEYVKLPWSDLELALVYAQPIEEFIPDLVADFVFCINCLDHVHDFDRAVYNLALYADTLFLSYDCGAPDVMHPLELTEADSERVFEKCGLRVEKKTKSDPWRAGFAVNYWLKR